jgi:hypothetical protein
MLKIFCLLQGQPPVKAFPMNIDNSQTTGDLKSLEKEGLRPALDNIAVSDLKLYKVSIPKRILKRSKQHPA